MSFEAYISVFTFTIATSAKPRGRSSPSYTDTESELLKAQLRSAPIGKITPSANSAARSAQTTDVQDTFPYSHIHQSLRNNSSSLSIRSSACIMPSLRGSTKHGSTVELSGRRCRPLIAAFVHRPMTDTWLRTVTWHGRCCSTKEAHVVHKESREGTCVVVCAMR